MPNPWFRLYSEFDSDPKVQAMPEKMQRRLIMLFCETCRDVTVTLSDEDRAFHWRISVDEIRSTKELFVRKGFCDENWRTKNWDKRQYVSDSSKERTKRWRENKNKQNTCAQDRHGDADVTKCDGLDTEPDTNSELKPLPQGPNGLAADDAKKAKTSTGKAKDTRHAEFKEILKKYWTAKNDGEEMPWDGSEAKVLSLLLAANPKTDGARFRRLLGNRFLSDVNHRERARHWLANVTDYAGGPLDRFKRPMEGSNGKYQPNNQGAAVGRVSRSGASFSAATERRVAQASGPHVATDVGRVPEPGSGAGDSGGVLPSLRDASAGVRDAEAGMGSADVFDEAEVFPPSQRSSRGV